MIFSIDVWSSIANGLENAGSEVIKCRERSSKATLFHERIVFNTNNIKNKNLTRCVEFTRSEETKSLPFLINNEKGENAPRKEVNIRKDLVAMNPTQTVFPTPLLCVFHIGRMEVKGSELGVQRSPGCKHR